MILNLWAARGLTIPGWPIVETSRETLYPSHLCKRSKVMFHAVFTNCIILPWLCSSALNFQARAHDAHYQALQESIGGLTIRLPQTSIPFHAVIQEVARQTGRGVLVDGDP